MRETADDQEQLARYLSEAQTYETKQRERQQMEAAWKEKLQPRHVALVPHQGRAQ